MEKILVLDDHCGLRQSLVFALQKECSGFEFLQAGNGEEAEKLIRKNADCSVVLLDIQLIGEKGFCVLKKLRKICPKIKTLVCTAFCEPLNIEKALEMEVQGYIVKTSELKEIVSALKSVAAGRESFCPEALAVMKLCFSKNIFFSTEKNISEETFSRYKSLSPKEQEVFKYLAKKMEVAQIAILLKKSVKTVENQRTAIYAKMNIHDRLEAVEAGKILGIEES